MTRSGPGTDQSPVLGLGGAKMSSGQCWPWEPEAERETTYLRHTQVKARGLLRRQDGPGGRGGAGREGPAPRANAPEGASLQLCAGRRPRILTTNSLSTARERLANNQPADAPSSD